MGIKGQDTEGGGSHQRKQKRHEGVADHILEEKCHQSDWDT